MSAPPIADSVTGVDARVAAPVMMALAEVTARLAVLRLPARKLAAAADVAARSSAYQQA